MQCIAQFDSYICSIHDWSRKLIRSSIRRDGQYYFGKGNSILHVSVNGVSSMLDFWHKRMSHPSKKVMKSLLPINNIRGNLNKACEVCFRAKQSKYKFPLSGRIFEKKIHCHI